ncbi:MAG: CGCGG family rSAM-modified RiPP protein [Halobacteriales archaeon]
MSTTDHDEHDHDRTVEPITDRVHDNSWSPDLETPAHADDQERIIEQSLDAIEHTTAGNHVNLVTHGDQGHPREYLYPVFEETFDDEVDWEFVEQCGCGGHVTRVYVEADQ